MKAGWALLLAACAPPAGDSSQSADTAAVASPYERAAACGECHPTQFGEWQQAMHAYAARSPVFDAMTAKAYRDSAGEIGTFCTGCHTPVGTAAGEPGFTTAAERSEASLEGVTCDFCHTAVGHDGLVGDASIQSEPGAIKRGPFDDPSDAMMHESAQSEFLTSPELCGSCHDVFKFPGIQIEAAYTEHIDSPAYADGVRCQDCHMSPTPGRPADRPMGPIAVVAGEVYPDRPLSSHRFVGPDYPMIDDFPYPDDLDASALAQADYLDRVQQLLENSVHLASASAEVVDGEVQLAVVVESLTTGHNVPTGFTSERQLWLDITVFDDRGEICGRSGDLDSNGDLRDIHSEPVLAGKVELDAQLFNLQSVNRAIQRGYQDNGQFEQTSEPVSFEADFPFEANEIEKHSLAPLEAREVSYAFSCPAASELEVALHYRNLPPYVLRALGLTELVPRLQVFTLDSATLSTLPAAL